MEFLFLIIGLGAGVAIGFLLAKRNQGVPDSPSHGVDQSKLLELDKENGRLEERLNQAKHSLQEVSLELSEARSRIESLNLEAGKKDADINHLNERLDAQKEELENLQKKFTTEFENLANSILERKTQKFTEQNHQHLKQVLDPLQEKIRNFEKQVEEKYLKEAEGRSALVQQIKSLTDLNKQMSEEASNLTKALKGDSKTQGDWGELRLEIILEKAGLTKGVHYSTQATFRDENDQLKKPDFIINLPENKKLIIDSKVSLTAYEAYFNSEDEASKELHLKQHIASINEHIRDLSNKSYQSLYQINAPDYVLMYIPIEPAFSLAMQNDQSIYLNALDKNIVLVTTSTLLATMSTVKSIWQQEDQKKNVLEIARQGGALYDKFVGFVDDLIEVGKRMNMAKTSYEKAMNKLTEGRGNLVKKAEDIKKLGAKTSKQLSQSILERANEPSVSEEVSEIFPEPSAKEHS